MKHVLVPLLVPEDLAALPNALQYLKAQRPLSVVIFHNPSLGITSETATREVDVKIVKLEEAKKEAAAREDYAAAEQLKQNIESAKMDRQDVLREGWKKVTPDQRNKEYDRVIVQPFVDAFGSNGTTIRQMGWSEDIAEANLLITLANLGASWPSQLPLGQFAIVCPRAVREHGKISMEDISIPQGTVSAISQVLHAVNPSPSVTVGATLPLPAPKKASVASTQPKKQASTREEKDKYYRRFHLALKKSAKDLKIQTEGKSRDEILGLVLAQEFPEAVAA